MRVFLVRHGQSEWNAARRLQGQADIGLSDLGRRQADALRPVIQGIGQLRTISSDLQRVRETAQRIGAPDPEYTAELREIAVGDWTGAAIDDLVARDREAYRAWRAGTYTPKGGESWDAFARRVCAVIEGERARESGPPLLVVCHGGVIRAVLQHYLNLQPAHINAVAPASLNAIHLANGGDKPARLELFNYRPNGLDFEAPD